MSALLPALFFLAAHPAPEADLAPHGRYVEGRTASVFAGACHFGGERTTAGREALLAWRFEGGAADGVELAGVVAVVALAGEANLAEDGVARRSVLYVGENASVGQRGAVERVLADELASSFDAVVVAPIAAELGADDYRVACSGRFALAGRTLPDRACCKMPFQVWYAPFVPVDAPIVGNDDAFEYEDALLGRVWSRPGENAAFLGSFRLEHAERGAR